MNFPPHYYMNTDFMNRFFYMSNAAQSLHILSCTDIVAFLSECLFFALLLLAVNLCRCIKV